VTTVTAVLAWIGHNWLALAAFAMSLVTFALSRQDYREIRHREDAPELTLESSGLWPYAGGFPVEVVSSKNLDMLVLSLVDIRVNGRSLGRRRGLFANAADSLPARVISNSPEVSLSGVHAGSPCKVTVVGDDDMLPLQTARVRVTLKATCTSGKRRPWVVTRTSGEVTAVWAPHGE
jgi:hypothetical protein